MAARTSRRPACVMRYPLVVGWLTNAHMLGVGVFKYLGQQQKIGVARSDLVEGASHFTAFARLRALAPTR